MAFFLLPGLMALLVAGTLAQRWMGLYDAHRMFFSSFFFFAGPVPLPGGYLLLGLLTINLAFKFLLQSEWSLRKAGINLTHLGVLVLLGGGLLTAIFAREHFMLIPEGEQTPYIYDYHDTELSVFLGESTRVLVPFSTLARGEAAPNLNFTLRALNYCENCEILKREDAAQDFGDKQLHGMARFMSLRPKPREQEAETNLAGLTFEISGLSKEQDGIYIAFDAMPEPVTLQQGEQDIKIILGKRQTALPFTIGLREFTKETYPGLDKAQAYSSDIVVMDKGVEWPARIEMNAPLRYKGYTFYQSSFERSEAGEMTILSVVENRGRLFPYIGAIIITAGLLLHIMIVLRERKST